MNMMNYDRKALKERAKASLRGARPRTWKVTLLYWLLVALIPGAISFALQWVGQSGIFAYLKELYTDPVGWSMRIEAMDTNDLLGYYRSIYVPVVGAGLVSTFITILVRIFQVVMSYGYANYALKLYCGEPTETGHIFSGFPVAGRAICTGVVTFIFELLWTLAAAVMGIFATMILGTAMTAAGDIGLVFGLCVLLMIAVWVAVILFSNFIACRYALAPYFILTTDMGTMEAVRESKEAMRGNLGRRFMLDLSFIGWELLNGLIVMGVFLVGYIVLVIALSVSMAFQTVNSMSYVDPSYFESDLYVNQVVGQLMGQLLAGVGILAVLAEVAALPIGLWLTAYRGSAYAGFFLAATGEDEPPAAPHPMGDYIPPQPSDIWDNVPTPPSFTSPVPPAPSVPTAPEPPVAPEAPVVTETPETPPEPEAPVPETPSAPETPAVTEASTEEAPVETEAPAEGVSFEVTETPEDETPKEEG